MSYINFNRIHTVIDIGTTKICTIIAEESKEEGRLTILGIGITPSHGLSKGVVVDIAKTVDSIKKSLEEASLLARYKPESAVIGASGSHIYSLYSQGMVSVKDHIITESTMLKVLETAEAITLSEDQKILHSIPLHYIIDGLTTVKNPLGMHAVRLEVEAHLISGNIASIQNLINSCKEAGCEVSDVVLEPLASAEAILNQDEKELGAIIVDIGGGTADVAFYLNGSVFFTHILSIAGNIFTQDIAIVLETNYKEAERLKKEHGASFEEADKKIVIEAIDGCKKEISLNMVYMILEARAIELGEQIKEIINIHKINMNMPSGIILTGGGSLLKKLDKIIEEITGIKTRIAVPFIDSELKKGLDHPSYATAYGLLKYIILKQQKKLSQLNGNLFNRIFSRMRLWVGDMF